MSLLEMMITTAAYLTLGRGVPRNSLHGPAYLNLDLNLARFSSDEGGQGRTNSYDRCQFIQCSQPPKRCDLYRCYQFAFLRSGCGSLAGAAYAAQFGS